MAADLLIFTTAAGRYRVYADLFVFCAKRAYPEYDVQVMCLDGTRYAMQVPPIVDVERASETIDVAYVAITGIEKQYSSACFRYLVNPEGNYKYVYITDIDMMIVRENPTIEEFHCMELLENGMMHYSNRPRWKEPMGENRMTGLHFVTYYWWNVTQNARFEEAKKLASGEIGGGKCDDELMLMRIVKNSGLPVTERGNLIERHHGIHLGTIRDHMKGTIQERRSAIMTRLSREKAIYWCNLIETIEYKKLFSEIKKQDRQATMELTELEKFARQIGGSR